MNCFEEDLDDIIEKYKSKMLPGIIQPLKNEIITEVTEQIINAYKVGLDDGRVQDMEPLHTWFEK